MVAVQARQTERLARLLALSSSSGMWQGSTALAGAVEPPAPKLKAEKKHLKTQGQDQDSRKTTKGQDRTIPQPRSTRRAEASCCDH